MDGPNPSSLEDDIKESPITVKKHLTECQKLIARPAHQKELLSRFIWDQFCSPVDGQLPPQEQKEIMKDVKDQAGK